VFCDLKKDRATRIYSSKFCGSPVLKFDKAQRHQLAAVFTLIFSYFYHLLKLTSQHPNKLYEFQYI